MSIRVQLLLIALTTLVLPWAGCQYARDLETTLRLSQENALQAAADTIANALSAQPARVFGDSADPRPFSAAEGDLYVHPLHNPPLLDGYREDWNVDAEAQPLAAAGLTARLLAGGTERFLFLFVEVDDPHFDPEPGDAHPERDAFDRVNLRLERPDGTTEDYFFATGAPGPIEGQRSVRDPDGADLARLEPRLQAFWLQTSQGYHLEARIPRALLSGRLWIEVVDGAGGATAGSAGLDSHRGGRLIGETAGLSSLLATFIRAGTRATVVDRDGLIRGAAGSLITHREDGGQAPEAAWYRRFVAGDTSRWPLQTTASDRLRSPLVSAALAGHPGAEWFRVGVRGQPLLSTVAPIEVGDRAGGAVVLEQSGDQLLDLRDRALSRLFATTLLASLLAGTIAFGIASWISRRIDRLRLAADGAVGNDGLIRREMPEADRGDEIGALARAFERLLGRLNEHTRYLRTLGGKLSHELRTPLTIVRSSLDNLESEGVRSDQQGYVTRAREGIARLQSILSALGAAARVEESIRQAERVNFDLAALLQSAVAGYRDAFRTARIELEMPPDACFLRGAPDLIVQMLDKLVENAVDFCTPDGRIVVRLTRAAGSYELSVGNDGPPIPEGMIGRLFESLFEHRPGEADRPHFGLGLYIVRLIAEFHDGRATAINRPLEAGAEFKVTLPLI